MTRDTLALMTDPEADAWFEAHGDCTMTRATGMTSFELWRKGRKTVTDHSVGFVFPESLPPPDPLEVRRFLVRWFVKAYPP